MSVCILLLQGVANPTHSFPGAPAQTARLVCKITANESASKRNCFYVTFSFQPSLSLQRQSLIPTSPWGGRHGIAFCASCRLRELLCFLCRHMDWGGENRSSQPARPLAEGPWVPATRLHFPDVKTLAAATRPLPSVLTCVAERCQLSLEAGSELSPATVNHITFHLRTFRWRWPETESGTECMPGSFPLSCKT